jgi:hypothetical protein
MNASGKDVQVDLAHYDFLMAWQPIVGDVVVWHGWITHWFGIVSKIDPSGHLTIIQSGLPFSLFTMDQDEMKKKAKKVHVTKIKRGGNGEWTVIQSAKSQVTWFI